MLRDRLLNRDWRVGSPPLQARETGSPAAALTLLGGGSEEENELVELIAGMSDKISRLEDENSRLKAGLVPGAPLLAHQPYQTPSPGFPSPGFDPNTTGSPQGGKAMKGQKAPPSGGSAMSIPGGAEMPPAAVIKLQPPPPAKKGGLLSKLPKPAQKLFGKGKEEDVKVNFVECTIGSSGCTLGSSECTLGSSESTLSSSESTLSSSESTLSSSECTLGSSECTLGSSECTLSSSESALFGKGKEEDVEVNLTRLLADTRRTERVTHTRLGSC